MPTKTNLTLDTREWKPAVSTWQLCPSIHIPAGGRMPWEEVKASMLAAKRIVVISDAILKQLRGV